MTTKSLTGLLAKPAEADGAARCTTGERLFQIAFGAIQWPWLLKSLYGGTQAEKQALLERVGLAPDALPHLGSWKADTYLLHRVVDMIEKKRPTNVVELGSGATSLVIAKALAMHGGGTLHSYDQHLPFIAEMKTWLAEHDLAVHPFVRGMADRLFDRIAPDGIVMLDDAARPGERYVAKRWRRDWPDFTFNFEGGGTKGLLIGRKTANV